MAGRKSPPFLFDFKLSSTAQLSYSPIVILSEAKNLLFACGATYSLLGHDKSKAVATHAE